MSRGYNHGEPRRTAVPRLLVEDNPAMAKTLSQLLRSDGHVVSTVANGKLALVQLQACPYDLILSDLRMPELDGAQSGRCHADQAPMVPQYRKIAVPP